MFFVLVFLLATIVGWFFTRETIRLAKKYGFVDDPKRKHGAILHKVPIPRAGGLPVYLAALLVVCVQLFFVGSGEFPLHRLLAVFVAGAVIVVMGLLDDKYDLSPRLRLGIQFGCALLVVWSGIGVSYVSNPFGSGVVRLDEWQFDYFFLGAVRHFYIVANMIAVLWIMSLMNMVNWASGLDGQNAGISVVALAVLGVAALREGVDSSMVALLAFAGSGAFLGFLFWSAFPQKIMPGFGGTNWSGFLIAVLSIMSGAKFAIAAIVLAVPIIDAVWVGVRRMMRGKNPMHNDRTHLHHYLLDIGWSKRQVMWFYWVISAVLGILVLLLGTQAKVISFAILVVVFLLFSLWLKSRLHSLKQSDHVNG